MNSFGDHKKTIIFDGGMGTELYERGFYINRPFEELNLTHPDDVIAVHKAYIDAGANVISTNTFSIPSPQLKKFDLESKQSEILGKALTIANRAREEQNKSGVRIGISLGPMGELVEPLGRIGLSEVYAEYARLAEFAKIHAENGSDFDLYILETFSNLDELKHAVEGIRSVDQTRDLVASITIAPTDLGPESHFIQGFAGLLGDHSGISALGLNCSEGPSALFNGLKVLRPYTQKPVVIMPNAGIPRNVNGRYFYMTSPDYLAKFAKRYIEAGANAVGGCCGTGPEHIRAIAVAVGMMNARAAGEVAHPSPVADIQIKNEKFELSKISNPREKSGILSQLKKGQRVVSIEVTAPRGADIEKFKSNLEKIYRSGVHWVNVPDGARAATRVSSLSIASHIHQDPKQNIRVLPHFTTRDRNLIALQSDLLGASLNGVHDVLIVTGDPPKLGNSKEATPVYDIDSIGLSYLVNCLNSGFAPNGDKIGSQTQFGIGVAANPTAINLDLEIQRWGYKVESGADFAVTQPLYERETFLRWRDRLGKNYRPHVIGIWPFVSARNAEFMAHEVPGVFVPQWALETMQRYAHDPEGAIQAGVEMASKLVESLKNEVEGFAVSAPLGKVDVALAVTQILK